MKLSIVSTMYRSEPFLAEFCERMLRAAEAAVDEFELILVNDGSPDASLALALELQAADQRIQVVDLSRNFGHHAAIVAGLEQTRGQHVFLIDCDLEEQPEWLPVFFEKLQESNVDVIFGVQEARVASPVSNFFGDLFWRSLNVISSVRIPHNPMTCRLMNRSYVDSLLNVGDRVLYLAGVFAWAGFRQIAIPLTKKARPAGHKSSYNLSRKLLQVVDSFSSFSVAPLTLIFVMGLAIWLGSIIFGLGLFVEKLLYPETLLSGFTSLMLSIWFLCGTIIVFLGVLGLYIGKIFQEVKQRPRYIVRNIYRGNRLE